MDERSDVAQIDRRTLLKLLAPLGLGWLVYDQTEAGDEQALLPGGGGGDGGSAPVDELELQWYRAETTDDVTDGAGITIVTGGRPTILSGMSTQEINPNAYVTDSTDYKASDVEAPAVVVVAGDGVGSVFWEGK